MQTDDVQKRPAPRRASIKTEGWREREEARNARVTPRTMKHDGEPTLVRW